MEITAALLTEMRDVEITQRGTVPGHFLGSGF